MLALDMIAKLYLTLDSGELDGPLLRDRMRSFKNGVSRLEKGQRKIVNDRQWLCRPRAIWLYLQDISGGDAMCVCLGVCVCVCVCVCACVSACMCMEGGAAQ